MENMNFSDENKNALLNMAANKLGKSPESIKQALDTGDIDSLKKSLSPQTAAQLSSVLSDPKKLEQIMQNKQLIQMLGMFGKK